MTDTPKECPKCGEKRSRCAVVDVGMRREWACGSAWSTLGKWQQSQQCRIRELEASALASAAQIEELQEENERLTEIVADDPSKWGFDALVYMAKRMLDTNYPASLFGDGARFGDCSGARLVTALRNAIEEVNQLTPTRGTAAEEKK